MMLDKNQVCPEYLLFPSANCDLQDQEKVEVNAFPLALPQGSARPQRNSHAESKCVSPFYHLSSRVRPHLPACPSPLPHPAHPSHSPRPVMLIMLCPFRLHSKIFSKSLKKSSWKNVKVKQGKVFHIHSMTWDIHSTAWESVMPLMTWFMYFGLTLSAYYLRIGIAHLLTEW